MMEASDPEINVDRVMLQIREAVAKQRQDADEIALASLNRASPDAAPQPHARIDAPTLTLQPEFQLRPDGRYHVKELLKYHGRDFVRHAYRAILKREPDAPDMAHTLEALAGGRYNKVDVLAAMRSSPEGELAGTRIDGLALPAAIRRLGRAPLVGYLIQTVIAAARLPLLLQHQRQSEFYLLAQQERIIDHGEQVHRQLIEALAQLSAQTAAGAAAAAEQLRMIESLLQQQQRDTAGRESSFRDAVENRLAETLRRVDQNAAALTRQLEEGAQKSEEQARKSEEQTRQLAEQAGQLLDRQRRADAGLAAQESRLALVLEEARAHLPGTPAEPFLQTLANEEDHLLDSLYASFEDQFRGSREEIKERLRVYLPYFKEAGASGDMLDVGCGRGEWLELLREEGLRGRGVDRNRVFVEQCRGRDLEVVEEDALVYLRSLPDRSLRAVTSFHLVEHLPFEGLIKLLDEMVRTLAPDGLLVLETPNPENFIVGSYGFYADPTHRNPIPAPTLQFLLESRGLCRIEVLKPRPWDDARIEGDSEIVRRFNEYFYASPDYGIVCRKA